MALFDGGLSTKAEATMYSGRGAGLSACYWACEELGGTLTVVLGARTRHDLPLLDPQRRLAAVPTDVGGVNVRRGRYGR